MGSARGPGGGRDLRTGDDKICCTGYTRDLLGPEPIPKGLPGRVSLVKKQLIMGRSVFICVLLDVQVSQNLECVCP